MRRILLLILLVLLTIGFIFSNMLASVHPPYSSMGNIAIFFMIACIPLFAGLVYCWIHVLTSPPKWLAPLLLLHVVLAIYFQIQAVDEYRLLLVNNYPEYETNSSREEVEEYIHAITQGTHNQMNKMYFNLNTWLAFISGTVLVAILVMHFKRRQVKSEIF
ncbi:hypothetical protein [Alkalicoccobacillus porphyridii]|uniref:Uncharacterized protein n=1 Tax=Alkalicoccobacillus porphyridii TaxID=2597270 RepID=A0A553ZTQ1_9BACI|nr:hypothetical protein [Alkalicoccobacillus porphyridii]TSB44783.1 hypothetical protein FN960_19460 [Alkalicoccobacillus porphyridii]